MHVEKIDVLHTLRSMESLLRDLYHNNQAAMLLNSDESSFDA